MNRYEKVLKLKVFNTEDLVKITGNMSTARSLIYDLLKKGYIKRVKHNLYVVCDIEFKENTVSQYRIATNIKDDAYLSYHSALEYYGVGNQVFYIVYVSSNNRFNEFIFDGVTYKYVKSIGDFGITEINNVKVTDKERTFIDCIDKSSLAGGNEELIACLELFGELDGNKILNYLKKYNSNKLYVKVGFFIELLNEHNGVDKTIIEKCREKVENKKLYFNEETKNMKSKYVKEWNLLVPKIFIEKGMTLNC